MRNNFFYREQTINKTYHVLSFGDQMRYLYVICEWLGYFAISLLLVQGNLLAVTSTADFATAIGAHEVAAYRLLM
ncbi:hypothetical protein EAN91_29225 [Klebsiella pneumoniae]|nr:hypothetical protein EAN91_29225 [Klebsiella pneumoniae]